MPRFLRLLRAVALLIAFGCMPAFAQDDAPGGGPDTPATAPEKPAAKPADKAVPPNAEPPPPIYEDQLLRLSEILGSLTFLRGLCGDGDGPAWREDMTALLAAEHPNETRKRRLVGRFNHGFETFNAVYRSCTPSAQLAISRYLAEGRRLSNDVRSRYSH